MANKAAFELLLELNDKASKGMKKAAKEGGFLEKALAFATGGAILKGVTAIGNAAKDMFTGAIDEAREAKRGMAQLDAVLQSTGGSAGLTKQEVLDLADSLSAAGGLSTATDDAVLAANNMLLTFTNIKKDVFPGAASAALDMATAMNNGATPSLEDLQSKAVLVGKALNDPIKGVTALTRVGVTFTAEQKKMIAEMVKTGDTAGAQQLILAELNKEFGGSAKAAADASGGMAQLEGKMDNLKQKVGEVLLPVIDGFVSFLNTTALPAVEGLGEAFASGDPTAFKDAISGLPGPIQALVSPLGDVAANAGKFFKAVQTGDPEAVKQFWKDLGGPVGFVGQKLTEAALAVGDFFKGMKGEGSEGANAFWVNFNKGIDLARTKGGEMWTTLLHPQTGETPADAWLREMKEGLDLARAKGETMWEKILHPQTGETPAQAWMREMKEGLDLAQTKGREFWQTFLLNNINPNESPAAAWMREMKEGLDLARAKGETMWEKILHPQTGETPAQAFMREMHEGLDLAQTKGGEFWTKFLTLNDIAPNESPAAAWMRTMHEGLDIAQTKGGEFWQGFLHPAVGQTPAEKFMENLKAGLNTVKQGAIDFWNNLSRGAQTAIDWIQKAIDKINELIRLFMDLPGSTTAGGGGGGGADGKASGGPVTASTPYIVGERGPELFVPRSPGTIIPNHRLAGAGGVAGGSTTNIYVTVQAPLLAMNREQVANEIAEMLYDRLAGR